MIESDVLLRLCISVDSYYGIDEPIQDIMKDQPVSVLSIDWVSVLIVECLVIHTDQGDIFVFKSSDSKEDWDDNFKFFPKTIQPSVCGCCTKSAVHTGFNRQFTILEPELVKHIHNTKAIFTGFSLGGALATLSAYTLGYKTRELVTFGSPKVGNQVFVKELEPKLRRNERWVYRKDYVTRLPPGRYYKHTGKLFVLGYPRMRHSYTDGPFFYCNTRHQHDHNLEKYRKAMNC